MIFLGLASILDGANPHDGEDRWRKKEVGSKISLLYKITIRKIRTKFSPRFEPTFFG